MDSVLSPSDTLRRGGSDALEYLSVEGGSPSRHRGGLGGGFSGCIGFSGNFAGRIGRFHVVSVCLPLILFSPSRLPLLSADH